MARRELKLFPLPRRSFQQVVRLVVAQTFRAFLTHSLCPPSSLLFTFYFFPGKKQTAEQCLLLAAIPICKGFANFFAFASRSSSSRQESDGEKNRKVSVALNKQPRQRQALFVNWKIISAQVSRVSTPKTAVIELIRYTRSSEAIKATSRAVKFHLSRRGGQLLVFICSGTGARIPSRAPINCLSTQTSGSRRVGKKSSLKCLRPTRNLRNNMQRTKSEHKSPRSTSKNCFGGNQIFGFN